METAAPDSGKPESDEAFGGFVAALLSIPCAAALQVVIREIWRYTEPSTRLLAGRGGDGALREGCWRLRRLA
jgi:hypothetical protein